MFSHKKEKGDRVKGEFRSISTIYTTNTSVIWSWSEREWNSSLFRKFGELEAEKSLLVLGLEIIFTSRAKLRSLRNRNGNEKH